MDKKSLLKMLPKTDLFASDIKKKYDFLSRELSVLIARKALDDIRGKILDGIIDDYKYDMLFSAAEYFVNFYKAPSLKRVINATGVIVHTNLGRSPL
ncbi:MAG: L-seryl-tRNA(Sec) selenium transferase, partial [Firmicutes bacterium]|nr:L-seryl-tRNA(Sec) selenium transferase [Bacillota bacterium]